MGKDKHQKNRRERTANNQPAWTVVNEAANLRGSYTQSYEPNAGTPALGDHPDASYQELVNAGFDPARWEDLIGPSPTILKTSPPRREIWEY